jgi:hypothetical protein
MNEIPSKNGEARSTGPGQKIASEDRGGVHPAWQALIGYCEKLQFGELEKVSIQNGLPMTVEVVRTKMRLRTD